MSIDRSLFEGFSDGDLMDELRARGLVPSVWSNEDAKSTIEADDGSADSLTEEQLAAASTSLLERAANRLEDALGARGNDILTDIWSAEADEILAEVCAQPTP